MYVRIEPSGCCTRHGMVQVRLDMFLDEGDVRYEEFEETPFWGHFIKVEPTLSDSEIMDIAEGYLKEVYGMWSAGSVINCRNHGKTREWNDRELKPLMELFATLLEEWEPEQAEQMEKVQNRIDTCEARVASVKQIVEVRHG